MSRVLSSGFIGLVYPGKRGVIKESEPKALDKLGLNSEHWAHRVQAFGGRLWREVVSGDWRAGRHDRKSFRN